MKRQNNGRKRQYRDSKRSILSSLAAVQFIYLDNNRTTTTECLELPGTCQGLLVRAEEASD